MPDIAVICDQNGLTASVFDGSVITVFTRQDDNWAIVVQYPIHIDADNGLQAVRDEIGRLIERLGGVRVVAGKKMSGVIYHMFDAAGFAIFEMVGKPERYLDFIAAKLEEEAQTKTADDDFPDHPLPTAQGNVYAIDLVALQKRRPEISSKMALLPFLKNSPFAELQVVCGHVPPWFDREFAGMGLKYDLQQASNGRTVVTVYHVCAK